MNNIYFLVTECQFGKQAKELGSTWFADLGPPFGVMYCIKCECISVSIQMNKYYIEYHRSKREREREN